MELETGLLETAEDAELKVKTDARVVDQWAEPKMIKGDVFKIASSVDDIEQRSPWLSHALHTVLNHVLSDTIEFS